MTPSPWPQSAPSSPIAGVELDARDDGLVLRNVRRLRIVLCTERVYATRVQWTALSLGLVASVLLGAFESRIAFPGGVAMLPWLMTAPLATASGRVRRPQKTLEVRCAPSDDGYRGARAARVMLDGAPLDDRIVEVAVTRRHFTSEGDPDLHWYFMLSLVGEAGVVSLGAFDALAPVRELQGHLCRALDLPKDEAEPPIAWGDPTPRRAVVVLPYLVGIACATLLAVYAPERSATRALWFGLGALAILVQAVLAARIWARTLEPAIHDAIEKTHGAPARSQPAA